MDFDVVIAGTGASGLTAAVVAANEGLKVLLIEKSHLIGGTTAYSLGAPWIVGNQCQKDIGLEDNSEEGKAYLQGVLGDYFDENLIQAYIDSGSEMVDYMLRHSSVKWSGVPMPDYYPDTPGARAGRTMLTQAFDGSVLGKEWLNKVRPALSGFSILGGLQIDPGEVPSLQNCFSNPKDFLRTTGKLLGYFADVLRYGRGAYLANGNALVGRLLHTALDLGVTVWVNAPLKKVKLEDGRVNKVILQRDGITQEVNVRLGVVLATGGFGASADLRDQYIPLSESHHSLQPQENVGDGIRLGKDVGGALGKPNLNNGIWAPVSVMRKRSGELERYPHFGPDRGKPGSLIVNQAGLRFENEAAPYQTFVTTMQREKISTAFFIGDHEFIRKYGMGHARPAPYPIGGLLRNGYLIKADTLNELAAMLGIDPSVLSKTVADFNKGAESGVDATFGRGGNAYDNSQGDPTHQPNPNLRPLGKGPFYAVKLHPGDVSTVLGLDTNEDGQVLDATGSCVEGLFAVGLDQNTVMRGTYPGGGSGIGPGMTFAYRAAMALKRRSIK